MIRQYQLVEKVQRYNPLVDEALLNKAYVYAMKAHGTQTRASGDPYFSHPLEVAGILTDMHLDDATIAAALLHDTVEDTDTSLDDIETRFGADVARIVEGVTKIERLDLVSKRVEQAENLRRLIMAISEDFRVLLVKLADRLHNMRTLEYVRDEKRRRISEETLDIYAPLAGRIGVQDMREELENLAFRWLHEDAYNTVSGRLEEQKERHTGVISEIEDELSQLFRSNQINARVYGRAKRPYSVWRKMERKSVSFEQLSDIIGFRIILKDKPDCYRALGIVHSRWAAVPGRFKDYISLPKTNDYQSIHTTVIGPGRQRVELQIRTEEMHQIAEYGLAAHVIYKEQNGAANENVSATRNPEDSHAYRWLQRLVELVEEGGSAEDFLEHTKLELFQDQVFSFTPKGRLISLPRGATPIDFAYAVHTDVGNSCVGSKINGKLMPLMTELRNGDEVEIIRSDAQVPPAAWEAIAVTGKARAAIRRASRLAVRQQYLDIGRQILIRAFDRREASYSDHWVEQVAGRMGFINTEDLLAAVGRGEVVANDVVDRVLATPAPDENRNGSESETSSDGWFGMKRAIGLQFKKAQTTLEAPTNGHVPIRGVRESTAIRFNATTKCVPGDRIVGIIGDDGVVTVYPIHADELKAFDDKPESWLDVRWDLDETKQARYPAQIKVAAINEPGSLAQIAKIIGENEGNIDNLYMVSRNTDFHEMLIDVEVWDLKHLNRILRLVSESAVVSSARRVFKG